MYSTSPRSVLVIVCVPPVQAHVVCVVYDLTEDTSLDRVGLNMFLSAYLHSLFSTVGDRLLDSAYQAMCYNGQRPETHRSSWQQGKLITDRYPES